MALWDKTVLTLLGTRAAAGIDSVKTHISDPETRKQCSLFLVVMALVDLTTVNYLWIPRKLAKVF